MVVVYLVHKEICIEFVLIHACCLGLVPACSFDMSPFLKSVKNTKLPSPLRLVLPF